LLSVSAASRKYQLSGSVVDPYRREARQGGLEAVPSVREKGTLERENRELKEKIAGLYPENVTKRPLKPADERGRFRLPLGNYLSRN